MKMTKKKKFVLPKDFGEMKTTGVVTFQPDDKDFEPMNCQRCNRPFREETKKNPLLTFLGGLLIGLFSGAVIAETLMATLFVYHF